MLHLNGSGTLGYSTAEGLQCHRPNIYYSTRVQLVLYFLSQTGVTGWEVDTKAVLKVWQLGQKTREMKTTNQFNDGMVVS